MSEFNQSRREGVVRFGYDFGSLAEVTHLFGIKTARLFYRNRFRIPGRENAIVCLLSENGGNGWKNVPHYGMKSDDRGWREILRIDEYNSTNEKASLKRVDDELADPQERYVFWRESRDGVTWYKFYGVFEIDKASTEDEVAAGKNVCIYRRKFTEGFCPRLELEASYEIENLKGKVLEADLLDYVSYELTGDTKKTGEVKVLPGQRFWIADDTPAGFICQTANENILPLDCQEGDVTFVIPKRDLELGYFKVVGEGKLEDTMDESGIVVDEKFDEFWDEFCNWWNLPVGEEELTLKRGMTEYKLRCAWDDGTLVVAMVSPWPREWDYAQLYRGMFGWADVGDGFYGARLRKKVAKLLLDEIIKRKRWMQGHGDAIAERERDIEQAAKDGSEEEKQMPRWFAEYRWARSHSESGAGDMRLYVPGVDCLFGAPIMCEWAIQDMG